MRARPMLAESSPGRPLNGISTRSTDRGYPREFTFRENMVVTIQPQPTTLDKRMGLQFGETVRITKTGTERLHHYPRKMVVIQS